MNNDQNSLLTDLSPKLQAITIAVQAATQTCQDDVIAILTLLRKLEDLHREIRDGIFQDSLPDNRQKLYALLKDMESQGGWPYIERMRLQAFLENLSEELGYENQVSKDTNESINRIY